MMVRTGMTKREATEFWVDGFNAIPSQLIERAIKDNIDDWTEITTPSVGNQVYVYDIPDDLDTLEHGGTIQSYDKDAETYCIELYDGKLVMTTEDNFDVERDSSLPMWGTLWSFGNSADDYWLEELGGVRLMSECGFRVFEFYDIGYFFGIDGAGYDFFSAHWLPLYEARGLQWHDSVAEEEAFMRNNGYHKGLLGKTEVWLDDEDNVVAEVKK